MNEAEIDVLKFKLSNVTNERDVANQEIDRINEIAEQEIDEANEKVKKLRDAIKSWDATLSTYCDGPERDAVRQALADIEEDKE